MLATLTAFYVARALGAKKARLDKMLPRWDRPVEETDWRKTKAAFKAIFKAMGAEETTVNE